MIGSNSARSLLLNLVIGLTNRSTRTLPLRVNLFDQRSAVLSLSPWSLR